MKQIIKRYSNIGAEVLGFIRIGNDTIALISKDKDIKGILNGCEIFKTGSIKESQDNIAYVISDLVHNIYSKSKPENFTVYKDHWASTNFPMGAVLDQIIVNIKDRVKVAVKVRSKESSSNYETTLSFGKINPEILNKNVAVFNSKMGNACVVIQNIMKYASIIAGHAFGNNDNVWGATNIQKYMDSVKSKIATIRSEIDRLEFYREMFYKNSNTLSLKLASSAVMNNPEERKVISQVLIPDIISNYENVKNLATKVAFLTSPLIYVDGLFRKNTNYPVSWFISDDVILNLKDDYELLINFLQDIPKIESNVVVPLDVYSTQILK